MELFKMNYRIVVIFLNFLLLPNILVGQFIEDEYLVTDVRNNVSWIRCSVGQNWNLEDKTCEGKIVKLNHEEISYAIEQASQQLGGTWRLPNLEELFSIICETCDPPKVDPKYFPGVSKEAYWTKTPNYFNKKMYWSVNFFTGHKYSRFFSYQKLPVFLVQDR